MPQEEYIRDYNTKMVLGIIRTEANGDITAIDFNTRQILGRYRKQYDDTVDFYGRPVSKGNSVVQFIYAKNTR